MQFKTKSEHYLGLGNSKVETISIRSENGVVTVNGIVANMTYNGLQLRFETEYDGTWIVFDDVPHVICPRHSPPKPIAEMFKDLGGK